MNMHDNIEEIKQDLEQNKEKRRTIISYTLQAIKDKTGQTLFDISNTSGWQDRLLDQEKGRAYLDESQNDSLHEVLEQANVLRIAWQLKLTGNTTSELKPITRADIDQMIQDYQILKEDAYVVAKKILEEEKPNATPQEIEKTAMQIVHSYIHQVHLSSTTFDDSNQSGLANFFNVYLISMLSSSPPKDFDQLFIEKLLGKPGGKIQAGNEDAIIQFKNMIADKGYFADRLTEGLKDKYRQDQLLKNKEAWFGAAKLDKEVASALLMSVKSADFIIELKNELGREYIVDVLNHTLMSDSNMTKFKYNTNDWIEAAKEDPEVACILLMIAKLHNPINEQLNVKKEDDASLKKYFDKVEKKIARSFTDQMMILRHQNQNFESIVHDIIADAERQNLAMDRLITSGHHEEYVKLAKEMDELCARIDKTNDPHILQALEKEKKEWEEKNSRLLKHVQDNVQAAVAEENKLMQQSVRDRGKNTNAFSASLNFEKSKEKLTSQIQKIKRRIKFVRLISRKRVRKMEGEVKRMEQSLLVKNKKIKFLKDRRTNYGYMRGQNYGLASQEVENAKKIKDAVDNFSEFSKQVNKRKAELEWDAHLKEVKKDLGVSTWKSGKIPQSKEHKKEVAEETDRILNDIFNENPKSETPHIEPNSFFSHKNPIKQDQMSEKEREGEGETPPKDKSSPHAP